jgi:hypothetical protein
VRRPKLALSLSAAAALTAAGLAAPGLKAQTPASKPAAAANPMAASRGARSLLRNGLDYLDLGEPERALTLLREAESRQFELTADERTRLAQAIQRARQGLRATDASGTTAPVTVQNARSRRSGAIVLNDPPPAMPVLPPPGSGEPAVPESIPPEPIQLTSGTRVESPPAQAPAPEPQPELLPSPPAPPGQPAAPRSLRDEAPPALLAAPEPGPAQRPQDPAPAVADPALLPARQAPADEPPALLDAPAAEPVAAPIAEDPAPVPVAEVEPAPLVEPAPASLPPLPQEAAPPMPPPALREVPEPEPASAPQTAPPALAVETEDPLAPDLDRPTSPEAPASIPAAPEPPAEVPAALPAPAAIEPEETAPKMEVEESPAAPTTIIEPPAAPPEARPEASPASIEAPPERVERPVGDAGVGADASAPVFEAPPLPPPAEEIPNAPVLPGRPAPPATAADSAGMALPPLPGGGDGERSTRFDGLPAYAREDSILSPETRREVEELARRQRVGTQGGALSRPGGGIEGPLEGPGSTATGLSPLFGPPPLGAVGTGGSPSESRIELPRPPSPTEPRPIRSIPIPEEYVPLTPREWSPSRKVWAAAGTCHGPLYFQDAVLERYGQSVEQAMGPAGRFLSYPIDDPTQSNLRMQMIQPFYSIGKFGAQLVTWPYRLVVDPPWEAEYDLGYYRPGDRIPPDTYYFPKHGVGPPLRGRNY